MAIFGWLASRRRLRKAARDSLAIPAFSSPADCTPWVTGGLWPAELVNGGPETAELAGHLKADLERIARSANNELTRLLRAALPEPARREQEARIVDEARARAVRRVGLTVRQLRMARTGADARRPDFDTTRVMPAVGGPGPAPDASSARKTDRQDGPSGRHRRAQDLN